MGRIVLQAFFTEITAEIVFCQENMKVTNIAIVKNMFRFLDLMRSLYFIWRFRLPCLRVYKTSTTKALSIGTHL
jgi:hypothetical protein